MKYGDRVRVTQLAVGGRVAVDPITAHKELREVPARVLGVQKGPGGMPYALLRWEAPYENVITSCDARWVEPWPTN